MLTVGDVPIKAEQKNNECWLQVADCAVRHSRLAIHYVQKSHIESLEKVYMKSESTLAIILAGIWINASEFLRNQLLFNRYWVEHYQALGLTFPSAPLNGIVWVIWGFVFAGTLYVISRRFSLLETTLLGWVMAFFMMWLVTWNLSVLPLPLLIYAVPLSLLEAFVGAYLCDRLAPRKEYLQSKK